MKSSISVLIIDDEPLAREGLIMRLSTFNNIQIIGVCASANDAIASFSHSLPDAIFLDIEMPGMSGLEFVNWLQQHSNTTPKIIFVTAFREFALNAFDFEAFDYLLKPFSDHRLESCITKLEEAFSQDAVLQQHQKLDQLLIRKTGNSIDGFLQNLESSKSGNLDETQHTISLKCGTEWLRVKFSNILWIEAAGDYMCVHTLDGTHIIRKTLKQFEDELNKRQFLRVNRSAIVNVTKLVKLSPNSNGEYNAHLVSGDIIKVTRKYKTRLDELK